MALGNDSVSIKIWSQRILQTVPGFHCAPLFARIHGFVTRLQYDWPLRTAVGAELRAMGQPGLACGIILKPRRRQRLETNPHH